MKSSQGGYERPDLKQRRRTALLTLVFSLGGLGLLLFFARSGTETWSPVKAGPLSEKHAHLKQGCTACHQAHGLPPWEWAKTIFVKKDLSGQCLACHHFAGREKKPHNLVFPARGDLADTTCVPCHTEHKGFNFNISAMTDRQCNACHMQKFKSFTNGHPDFSKNFPQSPMAVRFDHTAHFGNYFKSSSAAPDCLSCHHASASERRVTNGGFAENCQSCHAGEMAKADLLLFRLPQMEEPTALSALLLGVNPDNPESYAEPMKKFLADLAQKNTAAFETLMKKSGLDPAPELLAGLSPELVQKVARTWLAGQEYPAPEEDPVRGWHAEGFELRYRPAMHADPVVKSWIDWGLRVVSRAKDQKLSEAALEDLNSARKGAGHCLKCHAATLETTVDGKKEWRAAWAPAAAAPHPLTFFSHGEHLGFMGGGAKACMACHPMLPEASETGRQFAAIKKENCLQCHGAQAQTPGTPKARQDCLACHAYHSI